VLTIEQARERMLAAARPIAGVEELPTQAAGGRVLARAVIAQVDVPPLDNSQMDGYAVRCLDVAKVPAILPVRMRFAAGQPPGVLPAGTAARIFTGAPIPAGCDAVVMQEATRAEDENVVILQAPEPGQWIRRSGSDIESGTVALPAGRALRAQHLGIAASVGAARLQIALQGRLFGGQNDPRGIIPKPAGDGPHRCGGSDARSQGAQPQESALGRSQVGGGAELFQQRAKAGGLPARNATAKNLVHHLHGEGLAARIVHHSGQPARFGPFRRGLRRQGGSQQFRCQSGGLLRYVVIRAANCLLSILAGFCHCDGGVSRTGLCAR